MGNQKNNGKSTREIWEEALSWVKDNQPLVRKIAGPYMRHIFAEPDDVLQEAAIAAYQAFLNSRKNGKENHFCTYFRVIFRTNCRKLASGTRTVPLEKMPFLSAPLPNEWQEENEDQRIILQALGSMTKRERQVCHWVLQQPRPTSTRDLVAKFKIKKRHVRRLISNGIKRINGEIDTMEISVTDYAKKSRIPRQVFTYLKNNDVIHDPLHQDDLLGLQLLESVWGKMEFLRPQIAKLSRADRQRFLQSADLPTKWERYAYSRFSNHHGFSW